MLSLITNENLKIFKRVRTKVMLILLILSVVVQALVIYNSQRTITDQNWKQQLIAKNNQYQQDLSQAKDTLDDSTKNTLQQQILINQYAIDHNIPLNKTTAWSFAEDASALLLLTTVFSIIIAGDIVSSEFSWGTIKFLMIRPYRRYQVILAKYTAAVLFSLALMVVLLLVSILLGGCLFGFGGTDQPYFYVDAHGALQQSTVLAHQMENYGLQAISTIMMVTLAFMISCVFRSNTMAIAVSIVMLLSGNLISVPLEKYSFGKYLLFNNLDLQKYIDGNLTEQGQSLTFSLLILLAYFVLFQLISLYTFQRRDISA